MKNKLIISGVVVGIVAIAAIFVFTRNQYPVPADWKTYTNEKFGIQFQYPPTWQVCEIPLLHPIIEDDDVLDLIISQKQDCIKNMQYPYNTFGDISIYIDNTRSESWQAQDFDDLAKYVPLGFGFIDLSINPQLKHFRIDSIPVYGGRVIQKISQEILEYVSGVKGQKPLEYLVFLNHKGHYLQFWDENYKAHPKETETLVHSLRFDSKKYPR